MEKKAVFLDRDGVINIDSSYIGKKEDFIFTPHVFEVLKRFQDKGYLLIVVTNQSGIGRGYYDEHDFKILNDFMLEEFHKKGIKISCVYHCPHTPEDHCECRKPKPKMLLDAQKEFSLDMNLSWLIGDNERDIEAGINAGVKNLIILGKNSVKTAYQINSLKDAIDIIP